MPAFRYIATDSDGTRVSGECAAESLEAAAQQLEISGFYPLSLEPVISQSALTDTETDGDSSEPPRQFSTSDLDQVVERLGEVSDAGLPLITGMRALSEELTDSRLKRTLLEFSRRLESGTPLPDVLQAYSKQVPDHLHGLILAGLQTNQLGSMITRYLAFTQQTREMRRKIWLSLAYPILLLFASAGFVFVISFFIVPPFAEIYEGFDMELPTLTVFMLDIANLISGYGGFIFIGLVGILVGLWIGLGLLTGSAKRRRLVETLPIVGPLFRYASLARYCHLLALLVDNHIILSDALKLAGAGSSDSNLRQGSLLLAEDVNHGISLEEAAKGRPHFPASLVTVFRWERREGAFAKALYSHADIFSAMASTQTSMVGVVLQPMLLVGVGFFVLLSVASLFFPIVQLVNDLS